eukprot:GHVS01100189.1.p1 GENE.GHVS01100189.1~~GHVS01100189.1.p1  ORF type:complete len:121 (+),score=19.08 GHVS01100189.1:203-565(+)
MEALNEERQHEEGLAGVICDAIELVAGFYKAPGLMVNGRVPGRSFRGCCLLTTDDRAGRAHGRLPEVSGRLGKPPLYKVPMYVELNNVGANKVCIKEDAPVGGIMEEAPVGCHFLIKLLG